MPITPEDLNRWFTYHIPSAGQAANYGALRSAAKAFAYTILAETPSGPDQTTAIRKLRECVMTANAAIACSK